jgi:hypothetical protein
MHAILTREQPTPEALEAGMLARELAAAYREKVGRCKHELGLSTEEAVAKADEPSPVSHLLRISLLPPEEVTWADCEELNRSSPEKALALWEEVKQAALEELGSGHRAGGTLLDRDPRAFELARFLAVRTELTEGWRPQNGVERLLLDQMAVAHSAVLDWMQKLAQQADDQGAEQAASMVDRFNKMFLRLLRGLCDLRKVPMAVVVQNVGPVNVGPQVNLNGTGTNGVGSTARRGGRRRRSHQAPVTKSRWESIATR